MLRRLFRFKGWCLLPAFLLAGCNSVWMRNLERNERVHGVRPDNYRTEITAFMRTYLNIPTGVRGAFVSEPAVRTFNGIDRYSVCVRYDARKSASQYAGSKDSLVLFSDGRFDRFVDNAREHCKDAKFQPFPELERLAR